MGFCRSTVSFVALVLVAGACGGVVEPGSGAEGTEPVAAGAADSTQPGASGSPSLPTEGPLTLSVQGAERPIEVSLGDTGGSETAELAAALDDAKQRWVAADISTYHYEAELSHDAEVNPEWFCGLGPTITVEVIDGVVEQAEDINGCELDLADANRQPLTVEEWFDFLENMLDGEPAAFLDAEIASSLAASFTDIGLPTSVRWAGENSWSELSMRSAATGPLDRSQPDRLLADLAVAKAVWAETGGNSYSFRVERSCFCDPASIGPFEVTVSNGEVVEATWNGEPVGERAPVELFTVSGLFDEVAGSANHEFITVEYDPVFGFPTLIDSNPRQDTSDDESVVSVTDFSILDS